MKLLWCWRCKAEVPMLDDDEFKRMTSLRGTGTEGDLRERQFGPVLREYERITGFRETNPNAVYHHHLSLYASLSALRKTAKDTAGQDMWVLYESNWVLNLDNY